MEHGIPVRFQESTLQPLHSIMIHDMSQRTLFTRARKVSPTVVAVSGTKARVLGCYGAHPWHASATRYHGTGESFVLGTAHEQCDALCLYKWSRANPLFQFPSGYFWRLEARQGFCICAMQEFLGTTNPL